jgi:elongation factor G
MPAVNPRKQPIPDSEKERAEALHKELVEKAAENDETLMEHYFDKGELDEDEMRHRLEERHDGAHLLPGLLPERPAQHGQRPIDGLHRQRGTQRDRDAAEADRDGATLSCTVDGPTVLFTFKTVIEPRAGHITLFKVMSGEVKEGMDLVNDNTGGTERINQLFIVDGKERKPVDKLVAGDIGGTIKLKDTATAHTLHAPGKAIKLQPIAFPEPRLRQVIKAVDSETGGEAACGVVGDPEGGPHRGAALQPRDRAATRGWPRRTAPEPLEVEIEPPLQGGAEFGSPRIPYRETIRKSAEASYRHKKQTGGSGQFGEVHLKIEPWTRACQNRRSQRPRQGGA